MPVLEGWASGCMVLQATSASAEAMNTKAAHRQTRQNKTISDLI